MVRKISTRIAKASIGTKLTALITAVMLVSVVTVGLVSFMSAKNAINERIMHSLQALVKAREGQIQSLVEQDMERVALIASRTKLRECLVAIERDDQESAEMAESMNKILVDAQASVDALEQISVADTKGLIVAATDPETIGESIADTAFYKNGIRDYYIGEVEQREDDMSYSIAAPMTDLKNEKGRSNIGVVVVKIKLDRLAGILSDYTGLGNTGHLMMGTKRGEQVQLLGPLRHKAEDRTIVKDAHLARPMFLAADGKEGTIIGPDYRGIDVVAAYRYINLTNWGLVAKIDTKEAFQPIANLKRYLYLLGVLLVFLSPLVAIAVSRTMTNRIRVLQDRTDRLAAGELDCIIDVKNEYDELGKLGMAFNRMAVQIRHDILLIKQAELEIRASEEKYRGFIENFGGIAFRGNLDFIPQFFHGKVVEITGYKESDFKSGNPRWDQIIHPDDTVSIIRPYNRSITQTPGYSCEREYRIIRRDGQERWIHELIGNVCDNSGKPAYVQGAIYDVTERRRAEEELAEATRRLIQSEKMAAVGTIACGVAHELNNPLMGIGGYLSYIKDKFDDCECGVMAEKALSETKRCSQIIKDLLLYSRPISGTIETIDCHHAIQELKIRKEDKLRNESVSFKFEAEPGEAYVAGEQIYLELVLDNLIENAIDAMEGRKEKRLEVRLAKNEGQVIFSVKDNGCGMEPEDLDRICEPFYTTKSPQKGTGLGLAISTSVITAWGGSLEFSSAPNEGTTVKLSLPATTPAEAQNELNLKKA